MRKCGDCIVCCVYLRIDEIEKPGMRHCPHVQAAEPEIPGKKVCYNGEGCTIYNDRPEVCKVYHCEWLSGRGAEEDRPDRCGVLIDRVKKIENAVECKPIWDGAADEPKGQAAIERISKDAGKVALVTSFYERRLVRVVGRP